jgi:hypothetical protein
MYANVGVRVRALCAAALRRCGYVYCFFAKKSNTGENGFRRVARKQKGKGKEKERARAPPRRLKR